MLIVTTEGRKRQQLGKKSTQPRHATPRARSFLVSQIHAAESIRPLRRSIPRFHFLLISRLLVPCALSPQNPSLSAGAAAAAVSGPSRVLPPVRSRVGAPSAGCMGAAASGSRPCAPAGDESGRGAVGLRWAGARRGGPWADAAPALDDVVRIIRSRRRQGRAHGARHRPRPHADAAQPRM